MTKRLLAACFLALAATPVHAQWTANVDENGLRTATVAGEAHFASAKVPATLKLQCRPGADGTVAWELALSESTRLSDFGFSDYEGPDARASKDRLTEIVPEGGLLRTTVRAAAAGYYGVDPDTFILSVSAPANAASDVALLGELIGPHTSAVQWTTKSLKVQGAAIVARFPAEGAAPLLRETMMGCGPAMPLDAAALERMLGRNPAASNLFAQRAVEWRMKSLLGREYDAVLARFAASQPLARDGDVWFVLADPREGAHGASAILFDETRMDIVLADAEGTRRYGGSGAQPLAAPQAVRDFIAKHAQ